MTHLAVGSRGSQLALKQTQDVVDRLTAANPGVTCRIVIIRTKGDKITNVPLAGVGDRGLFVREIENALLRGEIDIAVHSAKDLPSEMDPDLCVAAYPERADPADGLVSRCGGLSELPSRARVGTSSIRRRAQLMHARPDVEVADIRGNLDTRLRKLDDGGYDAIVLACAGLARMGWGERLTERLDYGVCLPAVGQGAIAVQCRAGSRSCAMAASIDDAAVRRCVSAERALLATLDAGCQTPVAALAAPQDDGIRLDALVCSLDGHRILRMQESGSADESHKVGETLGRRLMESGAIELMEEARRGALVDGMGAA